MTRALLLWALVSLPAFGYNEAVHALITRTALPDGTPVSPPSAADLDAFREIFWRRGSAHEGFARKFPAPQSFTAWEFKQFLMLDPVKAFFDIRVQDVFRLIADSGENRFNRIVARASRAKAVAVRFESCLPFRFQH